MSATRSTGIVLTLVVLMSFFMITIQPTSAQPHFAQDSSGSVGIAAFGPFVAGFYEVVRGQNLSSNLAVKNTGKVVEDITLNASVLGDAAKISFSISAVAFSIFPEEVRMVEVSVLVLSNETDYVTIQIDVRASGRDLRNDTNIIECGVRISSVFHIAGEGFLLVTHIVDQHGNPYTGLQVEVLRDVIVSYGKHHPDSNATWHTMLASGNYTTRIWRGMEIARTVDFELERDMVLTIRVDRPDPGRLFWTLNLFELAIGIGLGYFLRRGEIWYSKRRRAKKMNHTLSPQEKEMWDWATRGIE